MGSTVNRKSRVEDVLWEFRPALSRGTVPPQPERTNAHAGSLTAHTWTRIAGREDGYRHPTASFPRFENQLEAIAETARRAGVFIDPVKHDWNPNVIVRAHGGPWLISPWSSGSSHGWCAQQMVEVEEAWLRVPDTRGWVGTADLEPDLIVAKLLEAVELPKEPSGYMTVSTERVSNHEILGRLAWLRSFGLPNAKFRLDERSSLAVAWLSASLSSSVATFGKELGAKAGAATAEVVIEGARGLSNYLRAHLQLNHGDLPVHDHSHHLLFVSQAETDPLPSEASQQVRLHFHDGEGMLDWDTAARRWRLSTQGRRRAVPDVPQPQVHPPHPRAVILSVHDESDAAVRREDQEVAEAETQPPAEEDPFTVSGHSYGHVDERGRIKESWPLLDTEKVEEGFRACKARSLPMARQVTLDVM